MRNILNIFGGWWALNSISREGRWRAHGIISMNYEALNNKCAVNICTWVRIYFSQGFFFFPSSCLWGTQSCQESPWPQQVELHFINSPLRLCHFPGHSNHQQLHFLHPAALFLNPGEKYSLFNYDWAEAHGLWPLEVFKVPNLNYS